MIRFAVWSVFALGLTAQQGASVIPLRSPNRFEGPRIALQEQAQQAFDVASVKVAPPFPQRSGPMGVGTRSVVPGGLHVNAGTLAELIRFAYSVYSSEQISGLTDWMVTDRWSIEARTPAGTSDLTQNLGLARQMTQRLLVERFNLQIHSEVRTLPIYELHLAGEQPKNLKPADDPSQPQGIYSPDREGNVFAQAVNMATLAVALSAGLDRLVIDRTGLTGTYQFRVPSGVVSGTPGPEAREITDRNLVSELGLKLVDTKAPVSVYIVTGADRPQSNL